MNTERNGTVSGSALPARKRLQGYDFSQAVSGQGKPAESVQCSEPYVLHRRIVSRFFRKNQIQSFGSRQLTGYDIRQQIILQFGKDDPYSCSVWFPTGLLLHDAAWHIRASEHSVHQEKHRSPLFDV